MSESSRETCPAQPEGHRDELSFHDLSASIQNLYDRLGVKYPELQTRMLSGNVVELHHKFSGNVEHCEPFRLILRHHHHSEPMEACLITFNGKMVVNESFKEDLFSYKLLWSFSRGIRLCQGINDDLDLESLNPSIVFIESFNGDCYIRSRECNYALWSGQESCQACVALEKKLANQSALSSSKNKPNFEPIHGAKVICLDKNSLEYLIEQRGPLKSSENNVGHSLDRLDNVIRSGQVHLKLSKNLELDQGQKSTKPRIDKTTINQSSDDKDSAKKVVLKPRKIKKSFRERKSVKKKSSSDQEVKNENEMTKQTERSNVLRQCDVCLFKHDKAYVFDKHVETHIKRYDLNTPITCPTCKETLKTKFDLNPHYQAVHDKSLGCCVECLEIMGWEKLKRHLAYVHYILPKNKLCPHCGEAFKTQQDVDIHISVNHDKTAQRCICDHCGRLFEHPKLLTRHIQRSHAISKGLFKCPFCDKVFEKSHGWNKHLKIHSRHKPYKCGWCDYRSVNRFNVRLHMRKKHKETASYDDLVMEGGFDFGVKEKPRMEAFKVKKKK